MQARSDQASPLLPKLAWFCKDYAVPILVGSFVLIFYLDTADLSGRQAYYPRFIVLAVALLVCLDAVASTSRRRRDAHEARRHEGAQEGALQPGQMPTDLGDLWRRGRASILVSLCLLAYALLMPRLGFYVSTVIFLLVGFYSLRIRPVVAVAATALVTVMFYVLFTMLLGLNLPTGIGV